MNKDINSDYLRGHVDTIILKSLFDGEKYGYEICKDIETKSGGSFILKQPSLYSALKRLEASGLISSRWQDSEIGGKRHYYSLTDEGIKHYEDSQAEWNYSYNILHNLISEQNATSIEAEAKPEQPKNDAELISENAETTAPSVELVSINNEEFNETDAGQLNFLPETPESDEKNYNEQPGIEPEKNEVNISSAEKNDAEFIKDTIIDEDNDVSFSNNVYFKVKNEVKKINENMHPDFEPTSALTTEKQETQPIDNMPKTQPFIQKPFDFNGYEIKPYTKYSRRNKKTEFIKKNQFFFSVFAITSLVMLLEVLGLSLLFKFVSIETNLTRPFILAFIIVPITIAALSLINLAIYPQKKGIIRIKNKYITKLIIALILIFAVCVINLTINHSIFAQIDAFTTVLIPTIFILNILLEELFYNLLKNNRRFKA